MNKLGLSPRGRDSSGRAALALIEAAVDIALVRNAPDGEQLSPEAALLIAFLLGAENERQTDGREMDGQMDGRERDAGRRTDGQTDRETDGRTSLYLLPAREILPPERRL